MRWTSWKQRRNNVRKLCIYDDSFSDGTCVLHREVLMSEQRKPEFENIPPEIVEKLKGLGYADMEGYLANFQKSAYGVRFIGDFNTGTGQNMGDGMMFATGGHTLGDAMHDALRVYHSQMTLNAMMNLVHYIKHLFVEPSKDNTDHWESWKVVMTELFGHHDLKKLEDFFDQLEHSFFHEGFATQFVDGVIDNEPRFVMIGDVMTVSSAIGKKVSVDSEPSVTDEQIEEMLNEVMNKESEEE